MSKNKIEWTPAMDALLGTMSDGEVADKLGYSINAIQRRRVGLGIPFKPFPRKIPEKFDWTPAMDALLGTMSDGEAAVKIGRSISAVRARRIGLGIPIMQLPRAVPPNKYDWTPAMDALLGTMSDQEVAEKLGRSRFVVHTRRVGFGLPAKQLPRKAPSHKFVWTPEIEAQLGTMGDRQLAEKIGVSTPTVANHRKRLGIAAKVDPIATFDWTPERDALLGKAHDKVIGQQLGLSTSCVQTRRVSLNIASYKSLSIASKLSHDQVEMLGTAPDVMLAEQWGVSVTTVRSHRNQKNIPVYEHPSRWTLQMDAVLGTMPDLAAAKTLGIPYSTVRERRIELGIASFFKKQWTPEEISLLGTMPDCKLAIRLGISDFMVTKRRKTLGIEAYNRSRQEGN